MIKNILSEPKIFYGVVEDRNDPEKLGRVKVRVLGIHTDNKDDIKTEDLPWAYPAHPITSAAMNGIGTTPLGPVEGTWVLGITRDGDLYNDLVYISTLGGISNEVNHNIGFTDPNGNYPRKDFLNESDVNRLARNENIDKTVVKKKLDTAIKSIPTVYSSFSEPDTPYNSKYPYNHVLESESGHIVEIDDTPGLERIHVFHKSGTFIEIYDDGTTVIKNQSKKYEITVGDSMVYVHGNSFVSVHGAEDVYIDKSQDVRINENQKVQILGDCNILIDGNCNKKVNGDFNLDVLGSYNVRVKNSIKYSANNITLAADYVNLSGNNIDINGSSSINEVGGTINMNSTGSTYRTKDIPSPATFLDDKIAAEILSFPLNEFSFVADDKQYTEQMLKEKGIEGTATEQDSYSPVNNVTSTPVSCDGLVINSVNDKLSKYFTLANLSSNAVVSKYTVIEQHGLSKEEIICNLKNLAVNVLDLIKEEYPNMFVTSGFRKGNTKSKHEKGLAADIQVSGFSKEDYYNMAKWISENTDIDALLLEYKNYGTKQPWVHVSYNSKGNRGIIQTYFNNRKFSNGLSLLS